MTEIALSVSKNAMHVGIIIGHFAVISLQNNATQTARYSERRNGTQGRAPVTSSQDDYAFVVGAAESTGGGEIDLKVEGVMLPAVLIDSGASCDRRPRKW